MKEEEPLNPTAIRGTGLATAATVLFSLAILVDLGLLCTLAYLVYYLMPRENFLLEQGASIWGRADSFRILQALAILSANVVFAIWLYVVHKGLRKRGATLKYSSHWAITGFVIPFLNFVRPFQVVRDAWRASTGSASADPPVRTPAVIRLWWEFVLVSMVYGIAGSYILQEQTVEASGILLVWYLVAAASCALAIAVVRLIERNLHGAAEAVPEEKARARWPVLADVGLLVVVGLVTLAAYGNARSTVERAFEAVSARRMLQKPNATRQPGELFPMDLLDALAFLHDKGVSNDLLSGTTTGREFIRRHQPPSERTVTEAELEVLADELSRQAREQGIRPKEPEGIIGGIPGGVAWQSATPPPPRRRTPPPPPPPPARPRVERIRVGGAVVDGLLISRVTPVYPELAKTAHIGGQVVIQAVIAKDGTIQDVHVISGHPLLTQAALDAVKQWKYRPYILNGEPVEVETQITVVFTPAG